MKFRLTHLIAVLSCLCAGNAYANWEYPGTFVGDGWYEDDGARFIISVRGGASFQSGGIENEIGSLSSEYYVNPTDGVVISAAYYDACVDGGGCAGYEYAGIGDIASLPATKDLSSFSFAAGASIGWTMPDTPQWRVELGWDHITEIEYNSSPLFEGDLALTNGNVDGVVINVQSGGAHSTASTDIISVMAYYDFFDGLHKPVREFIPYIGFGIGYADTTTTLSLSDLYGDLSTSVDLQNFGKLDEYGVLQFYKSEKNNANISGLLALGASYGITEGMFIDFGARLMYIPQVKWVLSNEDGTRTRDWYSANNIIYMNFMLGLRFEF